MDAHGWEKSMPFKSIVTLFLLPFFALGVGLTSASVNTHAANELIKAEDVEFIALNPLRGDKSPKSGKLWGNIRENVPSGMLVTFVDGFQSPPHIHNITYRAVVISGFVHNDDPEAAYMWMQPGSFWTQPLGETHITAAKVGEDGKRSVIFLEIASGPYLVKPAEEEFAAGELPVNIDARNVMWLGENESRAVDGGAEIAFLWGSLKGNEKNGTLVKLPPSYSGTLSTDAPLLRAVTIQGTTNVTMSGEDEQHNLKPGSYFGSKGNATHSVECDSGMECIIYLHTEGSFSVSPS